MRPSAFSLSTQEMEEIARVMRILGQSKRRHRDITHAKFRRILAREGIRPSTIDFIVRALANHRLTHEECLREMSLSRELALSSQFTVPTRLLILIRTFGRGEKPEEERCDAGKVDVERWVFLPGEMANPKRQVELELPFLQDEAGTEALERQLRKLSDPLGLKVLLGVLYFCHRNHRRGWFVYEPNRFADLLGYARDSRGYHRAKSIRKIENRMEMFLRARYRCEWTGGSDQRMPLEASLLLLDPGSSVEWIVHGVELCKGQIVYICGPLYEDVIQNSMYSWADCRFLQLDADKYGRVIQLGTYYSTAWRMDWGNSRGKLHRKLKTILSDSGIPPGTEHRNLHRNIKAVMSDHDFMAKEGFIREWSVVERAVNPLNEVWEIVIPERHGLILAREGSSINGGT